MAPGRYLAALTSGILTLLALVAAINLLVDPYRVFGSPDIPGVNAVKPDFVEHLRLTTPHALARAKPDALILGTSRAGRGLSPAHAAFDGFTAYNAALPAVSVYEMWRTLQHAHAIRAVKRVVLALDNRVFYASTDGQGTFREERLAVDANGARQHNPFSARLPDYAASLLSTDALLSSARTVRYQGWVKLTLERSGQWRSLDERAEGGYAAFRAMTLNTFDRYARYAAGRFDIKTGAGPLREIMRFCHRNGIDLRIVIPPAHAWHWEAMRLRDMDGRFEEIKRTIVELNAQAAAESAQPAFPVWDFSGYVAPNTEAAPMRDGHSAEWYAETVHFKPRLGNRVLDRVFGLNAKEAAEFGQRLDTGNLGQHFARWATARQRYAEARADEIAEIEALYRSWLENQGAGVTPHGKEQ